MILDGGLSQQQDVLPVDFFAEGVGGLCSTFSSDPVDGALELGLGKLRGGAAPAEPATGVNHQQASIVVFHYIGGMKIDTGRAEEDLVLGAEG